MGEQGQKSSLDTHINLNNQFIKASGTGEYKKLQKLLNSGANINAIDNWGQTALHLASINGKYKCVEILLKNNANINIKDIFDKTALYYASRYGKSNCVKLLQPESVHKLRRLGKLNEFSEQNVATKIYHREIGHKPRKTKKLLSQTQSNKRRKIIDTRNKNKTVGGRKRRQTKKRKKTRKHRKNRKHRKQQYSKKHHK